MNEHNVHILAPEQSKMARAGLGWGVRDLAAKASVATHTITRFEAGEKLKDRTVMAIQHTLETAGAKFIKDGPLVGVLIKIAINSAVTRDEISTLIARFHLV